MASPFTDPPASTLRGTEKEKEEGKRENCTCWEAKPQPEGQLVHQTQGPEVMERLQQLKSNIPVRRRE